MTAVLTSAEATAAGDIGPTDIGPTDVREVLARSILADGLDFVLDIDRSSGSYLVDARTGERFLDMFTFFASSALGMNHPALADDEDFRDELAQAAVNKPSNSDVYSVPMARFVDTFARVLGDPALPHLFFVDGGALAVENALKVAFDWKSRFNEARGIDPNLGTKVLHLRGAFHGRSGYTLSLTNTDPNKVARFPTFDWPRIDAPYIRPGANMDELEAGSLRQARAAFDLNREPAALRSRRDCQRRVDAPADRGDHCLVRNRLYHSLRNHGLVGLPAKGRAHTTPAPQVGVEQTRRFKWDSPSCRRGYSEPRAWRSRRSALVWRVLAARLTWESEGIRSWARTAQSNRFRGARMSCSTRPMERPGARGRAAGTRRGSRASPRRRASTRPRRPGSRGTSIGPSSTSTSSRRRSTGSPRR